ncbi:MAG: addiction module protein [Propionibacteriaceae bacterium]|nr:addiction module protein [Propionibacteriaceae bacterium]
MSVAVGDVTEAALAMSERQRAALADALLDSLDGHIGPQANVDDAWTTEIRSRVDDIVAGRVQTLSREQVDARVAASLATRRL